MCTVTFIGHRNGYALGMNRDESLSRPTALPPSIHRTSDHTMLFPSEKAGGTWIGVNDAGVSFALVNWYAVRARVGIRPLSRGTVVRAMLTLDTVTAVRRTMSSLNLECINPFRLIAVFPTTRKVAEWRWDLDSVQECQHGWEPATWISSGFDEPGAQRIRHQTFTRALALPSAGKLGWLRQLHRSHLPERGPYATCMHRSDAATVSYTEIIVAQNRAEMRYTPGAPCCHRSLPAISLGRGLPSPQEVTPGRAPST
jgi:hypothetical protein